MACSVGWLASWQLYYPFPCWRLQLGAKPINISIRCACKHSELYSNLKYTNAADILK